MYSEMVSKKKERTVQYVGITLPSNNSIKKKSSKHHLQ